MSRFRFVDAERARHPVARLCRVLGVSPSGFYAWRGRPPAPRTRANEAPAAEIRGIHARSRGTYGAPRVHAELRATGRRASRKRVARLMRIEGIAGRGRRPAPRTTVADPAARAADLVKRDFRPAAPDRLWVADITYIRTDEGWLYLAAIRDAFSRRVVGWALADHLRTELARAALRMALAARRPAYAALLTGHGIAQSLGRPGTCWDNAVAEGFFATLKLELVDRSRWPTRRQARTAIFEFIEGFYNRQRRHSSLGYLPPAASEAGYHAADSAA